MKNLAKFLGAMRSIAIIALVAVIGFTFATCDNGSGGGPGNNPGDDFVAVTNITGVPATATAGTALTLTGTVVPSTATNKTITWSVVSGSATVSGSTLNAAAAGTVTVRATIANGTAQGTNYTKDFTITVSGGGGGFKYTQAQYHQPYSRINLGQAPSGGQSDNFEVNLGQSTLPDFTTSGNPRTSAEPCGFSVTVNGSEKEIYGVELTTMWEDYTMALGIDNTGITANDTITVTYAPDGTNVFKNRDGKALEAFTITAAYNAD